MKKLSLELQRCKPSELARRAHKKIVDSWVADSNRYRQCGDALQAAQQELQRTGALASSTVQRLLQAEASEYELTGDCDGIGAYVSALTHDGILRSCEHCETPAPVDGCCSGCGAGGGTRYLRLEPTT